jgi:hypothetical protein
MLAYEDGTDRGIEKLVFKLQTPVNHPEESIQQCKCTLQTPLQTPRQCYCFNTGQCQRFPFALGRFEYVY